MVHLTRNIYKICPKKQANSVIQGFKKNYTSTSLEIAQLELENFKENFKKLPKVIEKVEEDMQFLEPLFKLPYEIRKAIYTSNAIESVNSVLRKVTNGKGAFATVESVYKLLYLRIEDLRKNGINLYKIGIKYKYNYLKCMEKDLLNILPYKN